MLNVAGYEITHALRDGAQSVVYRARRTSDGRRVILKVLDDEYPPPARLARFVREYELARRLEGPGVAPVLALEEVGNSRAIVMADGGAESLDRIMTARAVGAEEVLRIALGLAAAVGRVHAAGVTHKDLSPGNVIYDAETGEVGLIDFGISTTLLHESAGIAEGTPAYMSPEQTGRMNRGTDYRTDFYTLGASLYHLAAGRPPFPTDDVMELFHCHLARDPVPLHEVAPGVPPSFSAIVSRLMAKTAEERYQSAEGVCFDLERCQANLRGGVTEPFALGQEDASDRFHVAEKLYGREREAAALLASFDRASRGGVELVTVPGYSGIGKSALIQELHRPIVARRGYLAMGKFDQLNRDIPYTAVIQAFQRLVRQILTEGEGEVASWRQAILAAVGPNARVVVDVIPELALIVGEQPVVLELPPQEAQNRFNLVFRGFVRALAAEEHPLVLVLDDLQWADMASLKMIELCATDPDIRHALVLGAYRDNEVDAAHPLALALRSIEGGGGRVSSIALGPLGIEDVVRLVADATHATAAEARPLAELCREKTGGNPFFLRQFLEALHGEGLLTFERARRAFRFSLDEIRSVGITDNVVDLMTAKIKRLPETAQSTLRVAACVGNTFELSTLAVVGGRPPAETASELWPALVEGLVVPADGGYKLVAAADDGDAVYRFVHDRVQQVAYSLIPEAERAAVHLGIGRRLLARAGAEEREARLFEIVNHLNAARGLIASEAEREELARWNLAAGKKAKASAAYEPALHHFQVGRELLGARAWEQRYALTLALTTGAAQAAQLAGELDRMERFVDEVGRRGATLLDKIPAGEARIHACLALGQYREGLLAGLALLEQLGVDLPVKPSQARVLAMLARTKLALLGKSPEALASQPAMTDPHKLAAMRILTEIASAVYVSAKELVPLIVFELVGLTARYGVAPESSYGYGCYAFALCGELGDIPGGRRFGELALRLTERPEGRRLRTKSLFLVNFFVNHWVIAIRDTLDPFLEGYRTGLETGDLEYMSHCAQQHNLNSYFAGCPLDEVERAAGAFAHAMRKLGDHRQRLLLGQQAALNLIGPTEDALRLHGAVFDEARIPEMLAAGDFWATAIIHLHRLVLANLFHAPGRALAEAELLAPHASHIASTILVPIAAWYTALAALAASAGASGLERRRLLLRADLLLRKMRGWAEHAPANQAHRVALLEAERARVTGDEGQARQLYDRAIRLAREHRFVNDEAFASELAGRFYLAVGNARVAAMHLKDARHAYLRWGAAAKVKDVEARYPEVFAKKAVGDAPGDGLTTTTAPTVTGTRSNDALDLLAVLKASQAISGEVVLDDLLRKLMSTLIESAGAQRGMLLLAGDNPRVVAGGRRDDAGAAPVHFPPAAEQAACSEGIVRYVERTREKVVLGDAAVRGPFTTDPYVVARAPRSILCVPILKQKKALGVLYLENNLAADAFTPERVEVLEILSAQAAISLENARLYDTLESRVQERTAELSRALGRLQETQQQLVMQEKLASLGRLTSGIAHEIKNPLNFVNNFAELSVGLSRELLDEVAELRERVGDEAAGYLTEITADLRQNALKIQEHGQRAARIVSAMLKHSRAGGGEARATELNALVRDYAQLACQGQRSPAGAALNVELALDDAVGAMEIIPEEIGRVLVNLVSNALYATNAKKKALGDGFEPTIRVSTRDRGDRIELLVRDNGTGIPRDIRDKVYDPFFTTKPPGEGTGLGLSLSYEIVVQGHGGSMTFETEESRFTEFVITLPKRARRSSPPPAGAPLPLDDRAHG